MVVKSYEVRSYNASGNIRLNVLTACPKCGQLFSGKVDCSDDEWEKISQRARTKIVSCHICGGKLLQKEAYSVWSTEGTIATLKKELNEKIFQAEAEGYRSSVGKQTAKIKPAKDMPANNAIVEKVKADISSLKAYIQQLIDLEVWARFLEEHIVNIDAEIATIKRAKTYASASDAKSAKKAIEAKEKELLEEIEKLKTEFASIDWVGKVEAVEIAAPSKPKYLKAEKPQKPIAPVMKQPNFLNKKRVLAENERLQQEYEKACQIYEHKLKQLEETKNKNAVLRKTYEEELKKYNESVEAERVRVIEERERLKEEGAAKKKEAKKELDKRIKEINKKIEELNDSTELTADDTHAEIVLKEEKDKCLKNLKVVCEARNKLFNVNVIYPNYRDIFALSAFYEYFNSERCYELEGPNGAYNLYEQERRSDSFATFFRTLEDIGKNQVVLYREMSNMFKNLKGVVSSLKEATKTIVDKEDGKTSKKFVEDAFEKYFAKTEKFNQEIATSVEGALAYLK